MAWAIQPMTAPQSPRHPRGNVMTDRRRGVALTPMETRLDLIRCIGELADELGYEVCALPEGLGFDSTLVLAPSAPSGSRSCPASFPSGGALRPRWR